MLGAAPLLFPRLFPRARQRARENRQQRPPPGYGAPPPAYGYPPPGYAPPPAYGYPPPGYAPPPVAPAAQAAPRGWLAPLISPLARAAVDAAQASPDTDDDDTTAGGPMSYPIDLMGAQPWVRPFARRRVVLRRGPDGQTIGIDGDTGQVLGAVMQGDDLGGDDLGGDDDDDDDDDAIGADIDACGADLDEVSIGDDTDTVGAQLDNVDKQIQRIEDKIQRKRDQARNMRGLFQRKRKEKIARTIRKLTGELSRLKGKHRQKATAQRKVESAALAMGAGAGGAAATAALLRAGIGGPEVKGTRAALLSPRPFDVTADRLEAMRRAQLAQGLVFNSVSPPGSGRRTAVPFYADLDVQNPRNALTVPIAGITAGTTLRTRNLPYATTRIVGFTASLFGTDSTNGACALVRDFLIDGGTNLFLSNGWLDASQFTDPQALQGLRSYPTLQTTNNAQVTIAATGDLSDVVVMTANILVDVIADDTYGAGFPGAYAG